MGIFNCSNRAPVRMIEADAVALNICNNKKRRALRGRGGCAVKDSVTTASERGCALSRADHESKNCRGEGVWSTSPLLLLLHNS